jgi:hypothetical protein
VRVFSYTVIGCFLGFAGCGPLSAPMASRFDQKDQAQIDEAWEKAFTPIDQLDHQVLLDVLVGTRAYQLGIDKLYFRSEKRFSGGQVVMEVHFDRALPDEDRFEVQVVSPQGQVVREERYRRDEVEKTNKELFAPEKQLDGAELAKSEARWAKILPFFPKRKEDPGANPE